MGIIAFEMLTETTPFHSKNIHDTYSQILSYVENKEVEKLKYPSDTEISNDLRDLIDHLVTKVDKRLTYKKIITHNFFRKIDWMNIRQEVPPIIPTLKGEDDTSNFEEDIKKTRRNNTYDASPSSLSMIKNPNFSGVDLPFIGFGYVRDESLMGDGMCSGEPNVIEVGRLASQAKSLQKTIDAQIMEIGFLQQNLSEYQKKSAQTASIEKILTITKNEMHALKEQLKEKTVEIAGCRTQIKTLTSSLKIEEEQRAKNDANIAEVLHSTYQKWERAKKISEQNYEKQISEKKSEVLTIQAKLKVCERELESKSAECVHLQETIDNFKERLKSSKNFIDTEMTAFARTNRDSNIHFEGQLRELRSKLQKQVDAKHMADDEIQKLKEINEEIHQKMKLTSDQKEKRDQANTDLTRQLNKEMEENRNLRDEKHKMSQKIMDLQDIVAEESMNKGNRISDSGNEGGDVASLYCSLESLTSEIEHQLKKDLVLAKESENEQRLRANNLEETVKRLETVIERVSKYGISGIEELLERKNEKLEEKLCTVQEQATVERQASRTAHLQLWKLEKQLETNKSEKERLEQAMKKIQIESNDLAQKIKENRITARNREERITELQSDLNTLKTELQIERSKWESVDKERNKDKVLIVNQNTKMHKLEIDLEECKSKMSLYEQQKNALAVENQKLIQKLRKESEELEDTMERLSECQQSFETLNKNHDLLKNVCSLMETQLTELEEMYNAQLLQNKDKSISIDKLWEDIRERDAKLLALQREISDEKLQKMNFMQKSSEISNEFEELTNTLAKCRQSMCHMQENLMKKAEQLMESEELIEVQKEEIQSLQRINHTLDREIIVVKEENSKLLTELYVSKENYHKLQLDHSSMHENYVDLKKELEQLNETIYDINKYHTQREIKSEATHAQYKKLIDYLQKRVDELTQKKKKTLAEVLFGSNHSNSSSKKENIPPTPNQKELEVDRLRRIHAQKTMTKSNEHSSKKTVENARNSSMKCSNNSKVSAKETSSNTMTTTMATGQNSDAHQFEKESYSNGTKMTEVCVVCKKCFVSDTIFQCKKCNACVHQYCRGSSLKCVVDLCTSSETSSLTTMATAMMQADYADEVVLTEADHTLDIYCIHQIDEHTLLLGKWDLPIDLI